MRLLALAAALVVTLSCRSGQPDDRRIVVTFSGSALGAEGELLARHVARFEQANPGIHVRIQRTPDDATQRHQLFVQWLRAPANRTSCNSTSSGRRSSRPRAGFSRSTAGSPTPALSFLRRSPRMPGRA